MRINNGVCARETQTEELEVIVDRGVVGPSVSLRVVRQSAALKIDPPARPSARCVSNVASGRAGSEVITLRGPSLSLQEAWRGRGSG